jgi:hypothetical protein
VDSAQPDVLGHTHDDRVCTSGAGHQVDYVMLTSNSEVKCCNQAWVLKNPVIRPTLLERVWVLLNSWFSFLGGDSQRCRWLAEEAHQSLDVLRSRCQEELLADEFHATQAQAS